MLIGGHFFKDILQTERISFDTTFVVGHDGTDHCGTNLILQHKSNNHWVDAAMPYGSTWNISESGKILVGRLSKRSDA
eukprot:scaffold10177_cov250-Chaetoceros_neogracile.AAC.1